MAGRADQCVLRWFGHILRMNEGRMTKRVMNSCVSGSRPRGRPRFRWKDGVERLLTGRGMTVEEARVCANDKAVW